jgi:sorbitol-specific phosphotransferase system component IIA
VSIKLDELDLSAVKGQLSMGLRSQTSSVTRIGTIDRRRIIKHDASAVYGTIVDDQGKASARLLIEGRFVGDDAMKGMSSLRTKYKKGEPINLVSDITLLSSINKVMIEELRIQMSSSVQLSYEYQVILREYVETVKKQSAIAPPQKAQAVAAVGSQAADALQELKQDASAALQKAQSLAEASAQAVGAFKDLGSNKLTPSQKAQALQEVGSQASQALKEIEED